MDDGIERGDGPGRGLDAVAEGSDARGLIGARLKALYQALEQEPVPDLFIDLLEKLDKAEAATAERAS
ncbi:NepR family anti-sigma factor [Ensifer sp. 2YAB10]|uniref:NepR family anti-sigma factor n=1 Tax=unclassified Ensifer TaxID=2633371 RepID=UPI003F9042D5